MQGNGTRTADSKAADKDTQEFRHLLEGLETADDAPTDAAPPAPDADPADGGVSRKKLLTTDKPVANASSTAAADAATWMAAYLPPVVPVPLAPVALDGMGGAGSLPAINGDATGAGGSVAAANAAPPSALPIAVAQSVNLANYATVLEQLQSRLAAGGANANAQIQDAAVSGSNGWAKPVSGTATAATRADQLAHTTFADLPATWASAAMAVIPVTEAAAVQWAARAAGDKREALGADKLPEGGVGQTHFTPTVHFESAGASVNTNQPVPEAAVADQVSYWISQGIQNAELTFDGADAQPVQVSISLSGNAAHVEFRTDQLETRDLLTGAAAHLKDLLQSQGMVLSGLSVGSSGAGGAGARERRQPPEQRPNTTRPVAEVAAVRPLAPKLPSGRAVDLFV